MKREIEFRGKRIDNGEWVYGDLMQDVFCNVYINPVESSFVRLDRHEVRPETVGQFTGLLDKNGKKIFDGDVVNIHYKYKPTIKAQIEFEYCGLVLSVDGYLSTCFNHAFEQLKNKGLRLHDVLEVIGNIHDNEELLK